MNSLRLTSPNMKCPEAGAAQKLLKQHGYYMAKVDSIYGEKSALATKSAKWDLGYRSNKIDSVFDDTLFQYLSGARKPTVYMSVRAKARNTKTIGTVAMGIAAQFIGTSEQPAGSNNVMFSNWYGITGPWCAMFVTYCFVQAKSKAFVRAQRYAYCPYILEDAKYHRNNLRLVETLDVQAGDVVLFDWNKDGVADHVGIVTAAPGKAKTFSTIEGNTSGTNPSDGGMVARMTRNVSDVIGFVRVLN